MKQPLTPLQEASKARSDATVERVAEALAILDKSQRHLPRNKRSFTTSDILDVAREAQPEKRPLHRSSLTRNRAARQLIADMRSQSLVPSPCSGRMAIRKPRHGTALRPSRRRAYLKDHAKAELAEYAAYLKDLVQHLQERRERIEMLEFIDEERRTQAYPKAPYAPSDLVVARIPGFSGMTALKPKAEILQLEKDLQGHQTHLLHYDVQERYRCKAQAKVLRSDED